MINLTLSLSVKYIINFFSLWEGKGELYCAKEERVIIFLGGLNLSFFLK